MTIAVVNGFSRGDGFWYIVGTAALAVTALQLGHLGGSAFLFISGRGFNRSDVGAADHHLLRR